MRRRGWLFATLFTLLFSSAALSYAGWSKARSAESSNGTARTESGSPDLFSSPAANRYRECQPRHWRDCILNH